MNESRGVSWWGETSSSEGISRVLLYACGKDQCVVTISADRWVASVQRREASRRSSLAGGMDALLQGYRKKIVPFPPKKIKAKKFSF